MRVADGDRERIGGVGTEAQVEPHELLDHVRHLRLLRATDAEVDVKSTKYNTY